MFATLGMTAAALLAIQTVWSLVAAVYFAHVSMHVWAQDRRGDKQRAAWRAEARNLADPGLYERRLRDMALTTWALNFLFRSWLLADLRFALSGWPQHTSRIRAAALIECAICFASGVESGAGRWEAMGFAAVCAVTLFALGAVGIYSGRLAASAGDKRLLGIS